MILKTFAVLVNHPHLLDSGAERPLEKMEELFRFFYDPLSTLGPAQCILACCVSYCAFQRANHPPYFNLETCFCHVDERAFLYTSETIIDCVDMKLFILHLYLLRCIVFTCATSG